MGIAIFKSRDEAHEFKEAVQMAKEAIETICELTEEMEDQYGERSYGERGQYRMHGRYSRRDDWAGMDERRSRDSRGRYM